MIDSEPRFTSLRRVLILTMKPITPEHIIALLHSRPSTEREQGWNDALIAILKSKEDEKPMSLLFLEDRVNEEEAREIATLCFSNNKLHAVKKIKDITGLGLKESKDLIDKFSELAELDNLKHQMRGAITAKK